MSVLIETSKGDIVVDLYVKHAPYACFNFLKLCKLKYFNDCLFYNVQRRFVVQTGDPKNDGTGGQSVWGVLRDAGVGAGPRGFADESVPGIKHSKRGLLCMAGGGAAAGDGGDGAAAGAPGRVPLPPLVEYALPDGSRRSLPLPPPAGPNGSQFFFQTAPGSVPSLDAAGCVPFGEVVEGLSVLAAVDESACDADGRPLQNVRIRHTLVLDDPFGDVPGLGALVPAASPRARFADDGRLEDDWDALRAAQELRERRERKRRGRAGERGGESDGGGSDDLSESGDEAAGAPSGGGASARGAGEAGRASGLSDEAREAHNRAVVLEMLGDLPSADAAPPDTTLFVCRLNPATAEEDLDLIFGRYGEITECSIPRDPKTGESLRYAFVSFATKEAAETAYLKMNNVIIDERRIRVDFSQSVAGLWRQFRSGKAAGYDDGGRGGGRGGGGGGRGAPGRGPPAPWGAGGRGLAAGQEAPRGPPRRDLRDDLRRAGGGERGAERGGGDGHGQERGESRDRRDDEGRREGGRRGREDPGQDSSGRYGDRDRGDDKDRRLYARRSLRDDGRRRSPSPRPSERRDRRDARDGSPSRGRHGARDGSPSRGRHGARDGSPSRGRHGARDGSPSRGRHGARDGSLSRDRKRTRDDRRDDERRREKTPRRSDERRGDNDDKGGRERRRDWERKRDDDRDGGRRHERERDEGRTDRRLGEKERDRRDIGAWESRLENSRSRDPHRERGGQRAERRSGDGGAYDGDGDRGREGRRR